MKRLLISAAALSLLGAGATFAQMTPAPSTPDMSSPSTMGSPAPVTPAPAPATPATPDAAPSMPASLPTTDAMTPPPAPSTAPDMSAPQPPASTTPPAAPNVVGDMAAANPPPAAGAYPPCTSKAQDRCVAQAASHHKSKAKG